MVIGDDRKLILGLDPIWHGATHDAKVWKKSAVKPLIENKEGFYLAGDSAYPISHVLMKPYANNDALYDASKALFNSRLCAIRILMTENLFQRWQPLLPTFFWTPPLPQQKTSATRAQYSATFCGFFRYISATSVVYAHSQY